jgi:hypothetical protein
MALLLAIMAPFSLRGVAHPAHEMKVPQTAQDHFAVAKHYQQEAAELRGEIDMHKKMLAEFSKGVAHNPKTPGENAYIKNMRLHCEQYIKTAEHLAGEAAESAKFHARRAKELEGSLQARHYWCCGDHQCEAETQSRLAQFDAGAEYREKNTVSMAGPSAVIVLLRCTVMGNSFIGVLHRRRCIVGLAYFFSSMSFKSAFIS